jgi:oligopeptide transport system ATP-binding protein
VTPDPDALLELRDLRKHFSVTRGIVLRRTVGRVKAIDGLDLSVRRGETLGLVGESGCGKTTVARCVLKLEQPTSGSVLFDGETVHGLDAAGHRAFRRRVQAVFQDPFSSLNPRMRVDDIVAEPLVVQVDCPDRATVSKRVAHLLDVCGLPGGLARRFPHEMSGGQRQRVGIARALAVQPDFVVCDEAVSALDVSIQAQIINLLEDLRDEFGLTYLFIGHDLSVVHHLCHRVAVMYLGKLVELAESDALFAHPLHPYTRGLLTAVPIPDPRVERERPRATLQGEVPSPFNPPAGCVFHPRCSLAVERCRREVPAPRELAPGHWVACTEVEADAARVPNVPETREEVRQ